MLPLNLALRNSSKLSESPNFSSAYVSSPMLINEIKFSVLGGVGALTTIMKSCSAFGPSFSVILLVSSLETGFSIYQASCFRSLLLIVSPPLLFADGSSENGSYGSSN